MSNRPACPRWLSTAPGVEQSYDDDQSFLPGRTRRQEFEYRRGGTLAYFAAYDVHRARVLGLCAPKTGIQPFEQLVEQVMTTEPYASARRVFWIVDNAG